jgi:thiol-disulfide isomerase/thioredoxin
MAAIVNSVSMKKRSRMRRALSRVSAAIRPGVIAIVVGSMIASAASAEWVDAPLSFRLPAGGDSTATVWAVDPPQVSVVCFLGTECPLARLYGPRLQQLADEYADKNVQFVGVNSNRQDSLDEVLAYRESLGLRFPIGKDYDHAVAAQFNATRTPEVFVVRGGNEILYRGRIDDRYLPGVTKPAATRDDLALALKEVIAGQAVSVPRTDAVGCLLGRVTASPQPTELTYCNEVSRILQQQCVECHRAGEIGPFALTEYEEVVGWGDMMLEVIDNGRMPPWHAAGSVGHFVNARTMPEADKQMLREWVAGGMPYGDVNQLPPPPAPVEEWQLGSDPDLVLPMRDEPFPVPAEGTIEYQHFVVDPGFTEDRWIAGAQILPGARGVVHHGIIFIRPPDGIEPAGVGWLTAYVPGQRLLPLPPHMARKVPAGSKLVFQMHYTPNGTATTDLSQLGILFADTAQVTEEVFTVMAINQNFEIPPHAGNYAVAGGTSQFPKNGRMLAMAPHMHVRGKAFEVSGRKGDEVVPLLDVPRYDFNWQHVYIFEEPLGLDQFDRIEFVARYDNSAENPVNPDPSSPVHWGDQTWEEMAIAFFEVVRPLDEAVEGESYRQERGAARHALTTEKVDKFFAKFDTDGDGVVHELDVPDATRRFAFGKYDSNGDGQLTRAEVLEAVEE